ncbi:MAG TPA: hypothetical protein VMU81_23090 [Acetobacteraceae bacterium]|nr:hypothetical protein [Acetobacteraceae bacterium]
MHTAAVSLAGRHDKAAKLLHRALAERHRQLTFRDAVVMRDARIRDLHELWRSASPRNR